MGRSAKRSDDDATTGSVRAADEPDGASDAPASEAPASGAPASGLDHVCPVAFCPIGLALSAVDRVQPDVVSHLLAAGREFFLAAKAVMDVRAEDLAGDAPPEGPARMEHIRIG